MSSLEQTEKSMRYSLCLYDRAAPSDLTVLEALDQDRYWVLRDAVQRLEGLSKSPLLSIMEWSRISANAALAEADRRGSSEHLSDIVAQFRVAVFAAVSAVYAFQENLQVLVKAHGSGASTDLNSVFADEYEQRPGYLAMYKIRRWSTHQTDADDRVRCRVTRGEGRLSGPRVHVGVGPRMADRPRNGSGSAVATNAR